MKKLIIAILIISMLSINIDAKKRYQPVYKFIKLAKCESGGRWHINTGNGYYGGLQFSKATWNKAKKLYKPARKYKTANKAPKAIQIKVAQRWLSKTSWKQWGYCGKKARLNTWKK